MKQNIFLNLSQRTDVQQSEGEISIKDETDIHIFHRHEYNET